MAALAVHNGGARAAPYTAPMKDVERPEEASKGGDIIKIEIIKTDLAEIKDPSIKDPGTTLTPEAAIAIFVARYPPPRSRAYRHLIRTAGRSAVEICNVSWRRTLTDISVLRFYQNFTTYLFHSVSCSVMEQCRLWYM